MTDVRLVPLSGVPLIRPGDDLGGLLLEALDHRHLAAGSSDILVVCQKVVSKAEGRVVALAEITPSAFAAGIAAGTGRDARVVEVILRESKRIVRMDQGHLIVETPHGWVCANAGVDESNGPEPESLVLLPEDPDASARALRTRLAHGLESAPAVIVTDTFGRPWREGLVEVALGVAGIEALLDLRGERDLNGRELHHTMVAHADEIAAAAGLLMRKGSAIPAVLVRGYVFESSRGTATSLLRRRELDLFR